MNVKYLGSKRKLLPEIIKQLHVLPDAKSVLDLFSGTSRVGQAFKREGYQVFSNDHNAYAFTLAKCYVQADKGKWEDQASKLIKELNCLKGSSGYFTETFCRKSRYFQPKNGARVDAIREEILRKGLPPELEAIALVSLLEAADRVDSTAGVQMAYLKQWAARAHNDLELRVPVLIPRAAHGKSRAFQMEALDAVKKLEADVLYLDPPYNQHSYLGNYHIWETLVLWDKPEVYGIACKRIDCKDRKSPFNSKLRYKQAFSDIIHAASPKLIIVSFSNEGYWDREDMEKLLSTKGEVIIQEIDYKRYVGAQIGIYNLEGKKVGKVSHTGNKEYLYIVKTS